MPRRVPLIEVRAQRLADQQEEAAQDAVFVEILNLLQPFQDLLVDRLHLRLTAAGLMEGIELGGEQPHQQTRQVRIGARRVLHIGLTEAAAGLAHELAVGAQHHDLARRQAGGQYQAVKAIILRRADPNLAERLLELPARLGGVDQYLLRGQRVKFLNPNRLLSAARRHLKRNLVDHP